MKKAFRLNLKQSEVVLRKSIDEIKNSAIKGVAQKIIENTETTGGLASLAGSFLKAHGDVTWSKS